MTKSKKLILMLGALIMGGIFFGASGLDAPAHHGVASWYSRKDRHVRKHTANGEVFDDTKLTCAVWGVPFGTRLKVTNLENSKAVVCRVNDRGPAKRLGRKLDLSRAAFGKIANPKEGLVRVSVTSVSS